MLELLEFMVFWFDEGGKEKPEMYLALIQDVSTVPRSDST